MFYNYVYYFKLYYYNIQGPRAVRRLHIFVPLRSWDVLILYKTYSLYLFGVY